MISRAWYQTLDHLGGLETRQHMARILHCEPGMDRGVEAALGSGIEAIGSETDRATQGEYNNSDVF